MNSYVNVLQTILKRELKVRDKARNHMI